MTGVAVGLTFDVIEIGKWGVFYWLGLVDRPTADPKMGFCVEYTVFVIGLCSVIRFGCRSATLNGVRSWGCGLVFSACFAMACDV